MHKTFIHKKRKIYRNTIILLIIFLFINYIYLTTNPFGKGQNVENLAAKYSPILHFTSNEKFYPTKIDYFVARSSLVDHSNGV